MLACDLRSGHAYTRSLLRGRALTRTTRGIGGMVDPRGGGGSTSLLWGSSPRGRLDHYAHALNQHKLLVVG
jgi:hypothetical protein